MNATASRMICKRHNFTATVGSAVAYALDEYECPTCVHEADAASAAAQRPCCSRMNVDCCGHDDDSYDDEGGAFYVEIDSPNFCNRRKTAAWGDETPF